MHTRCKVCLKGITGNRRTQTKLQPNPSQNPLGWGRSQPKPLLDTAALSRWRWPRFSSSAREKAEKLGSGLAFWVAAAAPGKKHPGRWLPEAGGSAAPGAPPQHAFQAGCPSETWLLAQGEDKLQLSCRGWHSPGRTWPLQGCPVPWPSGQCLQAGVEADWGLLGPLCRGRGQPQALHGPYKPTSRGQGSREHHGCRALPVHRAPGSSRTRPDPARRQPSPRKHGHPTPTHLRSKHLPNIEREIRGPTDSGEGLKSRLGRGGSTGWEVSKSGRRAVG